MDISNLFDVKVCPCVLRRTTNPFTKLTESKDKVVLVTGGAKGVGRMISEGFVQNGAKVYISSRDAKSCDQAVRELNALGKGTAFAIPADFYKLEECSRLAEELRKRESS